MKQHFEDIWDAISKVVDGSYSSGQAGEVVFNIADATVDVANDLIAFIDNDGNSVVKKESIVDLVAGIAGTGVTASSGQLNVGGLTTSEIAAASLVVESEGIGSNDNDTTLPTSAAVKDYADNAAATLTNKVLQDYAEKDVALTSSSGVVAIDLANGNTGSLTLTENVTDIDFTNVPTDGVSSFTLKITSKPHNCI